MKKSDLIMKYILDTIFRAYISLAIINCSVYVPILYVATDIYIKITTKRICIYDYFLYSIFSLTYTFLFYQMIYWIRYGRIRDLHVLIIPVL